MLRKQADLGPIHFGRRPLRLTTGTMKKPKIQIPTGYSPRSRAQRYFARAAGAHFDAYAADSGTVIEVFEEISEFGVSLSAFNEKLKAASGRPVTIKLNSPGGHS